MKPIHNSAECCVFSVVFQHPDFIIAVKPAGLSVHCDDSITGFAAKLSEQLATKLFVVHRLDKATSGLMIFARSSQAAATFGALFETQKVDKYYLAISASKPKKKQGTIKGDMQKSRRSGWRLLSTTQQPAVTRFISKALQPGFRLFLVKPLTGKTHQIRVALKSLSAAIYGDPIYSASSKQSEGLGSQRQSSIIAAQRCYLHAWQLCFVYDQQAYHFVQNPQEGELFLSAAFESAIEQWKKPQNEF